MSVFDVTVPTEQEVVEWYMEPRPVPCDTNHPWIRKQNLDRILCCIDMRVRGATTIDELREQLSNLITVIQDMNRP